MKPWEPRVWKVLRFGRLQIVIDRPWPNRYGLAGITFAWVRWPETSASRESQA